MEISKYDIYAYQIMHYLITAYQYQVVRVDQYKEDLWLANPKQEQYPVIRISSQRMEKVDENIAYLRNVHRKILDMIHREGHLLLLNTCPDCFLLDNPFIKQIRVGPHSVSDIMILQTFRNLAEVVHDVEDPKEEMARLARSIEETQILQQKKFIAKVKRSLRPDITITVMAFCVLYALVNYIISMATKGSIASWIAAGAYYKMNVVAAHEYWRLLSAGFLHADIIVLLFSMYALYQIGKLCEPLFTKGQYLAVLIGSIFTGYVCMLIGNGNAIAYGISSGIWGISGAYIASGFGNGSYHLPMIRYMVLKVLLFDIFVWLLPGMSFLGNLGGMVFGMVITMSFVKNKKWPKLRTHAKAATSLLFVSLCVLGLSIQTVTPLQPEMDQEIIQIFTHTPMDGYARYLKSCYNKQYRLE